MEEKKFAKGLYFDKPREGAPEFVRGRMAIKVDEAIAYLLTLEKSEKGYVNFDLLKSKDGTKLYFTLNDWKPEKKTENVLPEYPNEEIKPEDIPFN